MLENTVPMGIADVFAQNRQKLGKYRRYAFPRSKRLDKEARANNQWNHERDETAPPSFGQTGVALRAGEPVLCAQRRDLRSSPSAWRFFPGYQSSGRERRD